MSYTVTQNTSFLTAASVLQKVISFAYFTLVARSIGVENTGIYFFAITFTTIFSVLADFGIGPVLTREASRSDENISEYFNIAFWSKIIFGLGAYLMVVIFVNILGYGENTKLLVYLSGITMFTDNLGAAFYSIFRARKNLIYESIGIVVMQAVTLVVGSLALFFKLPLYWLILAYAIPSFLNVFYAGFFLKKVYGVSVHWSLNRKIFKMFIQMSWPFALAGVITRLYAYSDSLLMSKMLPASELGYWSVPYKISFAFQFIPSALSASIYPVMSALYLTDKQKIGELFVKSWRYLFAVVFPLSFGLIALAEPVIVKIYKPQFAPSVPVLKILLVSLIFGFLAFVTGAALNAVNKQKIQTYLLAFVWGVNFILNLFLLPRAGIVGAAFAALLSNAILCAGGYYFSAKEIVIDSVKILKYFSQTFFPALLMAAFAHFLSAKLHFIIVIVLSAILYGVLIVLTGAVDKNLILKFYRKIFGNY